MKIEAKMKGNAPVGATITLTADDVLYLAEIISFARNSTDSDKARRMFERLSAVCEGLNLDCQTGCDDLQFPKDYTAERKKFDPGYGGGDE